MSIASDALMTTAACFCMVLQLILCFVCSERKMMMLLENRRISMVGARLVISLMQPHSVVASVLDVWYKG